MRLPDRRVVLKRAKGRYVALFGARRVELRGVQSQIAKKHFPYHIVGRLRRQSFLSTSSKRFGLVEGQKYDRAVELAFKTNSSHPLLEALKEKRLIPVATKVMSTNAVEGSGERVASCAEIDLVAYNLDTRRFACVEIKRSTKPLTRLRQEHDESPRCRLTGRKRSFLDMARMQAQLGAAFFDGTFYTGGDSEPVLILDTPGSEIDVSWPERLEGRRKFEWVAGYNSSIGDD